MREVVAELRKGGEQLRKGGGQLRVELRDLRAESRAQREALWRIIDRFPPPGEAPRAREALPLRGTAVAIDWRRRGLRAPP